MRISDWSSDVCSSDLPALDVVSEVFGPDVADELRRGRGRPAKADRKVNQTLRLDADVLEAYRQAGKGWQTRINQVLREHMPGNQKRYLNESPKTAAQSAEYLTLQQAPHANNPTSLPTPYPTGTSTSHSCVYIHASRNL